MRPAWLVAILIASLAGGSAGGEAPVERSEPARLAARSLLLDAAEAGGRTVAVGERGHVLVSDDGGVGWKQVLVPVRSMLTAVAAVGRRVWAVGHDGAIVHSPDDGATWTLQRFAPDEDQPLFDVWFGDELHGLAVGAYGLALVTTDRGATWSEVTVDPQERHLNAIAAAPDGVLYVAAEYGSVFRSRDRGATWELSMTPYGGSFFGALALRGGAIEIFGLRGHVYRSEDAGSTWTAIETGSDATLLGGAELADGRVVIVGLSGTLLVSEDGGRTFAEQNRPDRRGISEAFPVGKDRVLLLGEGGVQPLRLERKGAGS